MQTVVSTSKSINAFSSYPTVLYAYHVVQLLQLLNVKYEYSRHHSDFRIILSINKRCLVNIHGFA